ncbi:unnamed protein product [Spirodela intermedia]|uniref:Hyaluronan/mRNA-binding protein domain-containing protein n=1 Tax=Spirodela intermedia TaxID=51605 RepID=A0A7I8J788_SPIIN|nr:unnamed protein product [Spirodela intermedia]CAA6666087.1 unnamed protein product [Spirodela intermedia]
MATGNPFALLGDGDGDDLSQVIAAQRQKIAAKKPLSAALPSKPAPPAQSVKDARSSYAPTRGSFGGGRGLSQGRGGRGSFNQNRDYDHGNVDGLLRRHDDATGGGEGRDPGKPQERERGFYGGPRQSFRGGHHGGHGDREAGGGDSDRPPRRVFERRSGTGRGNEFKRDGSGRGNWGSSTDDALAPGTEEVVSGGRKVWTTGKQSDQKGAPVSEMSKENKGDGSEETEEKEPEDKEMTLDEYERVKEEKRKALIATKSEARKVEVDKDFLSMQQLSLKKENDEIFVKLKDNVDRDERAKKSVSINKFLKPADGDRYYSSPSGRGRGHGRGRGRSRGDQQLSWNGSGNAYHGAGAAAEALIIDDPGHFPSLGGRK